MFVQCIEQLSRIYNRMDSVLITNKEGIVEYSAVFDATDSTITNEGYTGRNILEIYPGLTKESSTHFVAMRTGEPVLGTLQTLTDLNGKTLTLSSNTYPIRLGGKVIGAIEGTVFVGEDGIPISNRLRRQESSSQKEYEMYTIDDLIAEDRTMRKLKEQIIRVSEGESPVMIIGDTGTGKEVVAQSIHSHSRRQKGPFISQNCSAIPGGLLESLLFGSVKGSYTGAENKKGLFELASGGTLFLDELNSMDVDLQSKILKAVEEQHIRKIGDERQTKIDVRILSAVSEDPWEMVEKGRVRRDLYYRLGVVQLRIPLLKERRMDIPILIDHYIDIYNSKEGKNIKGCSDIAKQILLNYSWPGNVRELKNAIEYAFNMAASDVITLQELPDHILYEQKRQEDAGKPIGGGEAAWMQYCETQFKEGYSINEVLDELEKRLIDMAMENNDTTTGAARALNISRQALNYKLAKYSHKKPL